MQLLKAFWTPILIHEWPDSAALNASLREVILEKEKECPGITRSNARNCWHSKTDLLRWPEPCIKDFQERVKQLAFMMTKQLGADPKDYNYQVSAWAMVSRDRDYGKAHVHPGCIWSGVYYVDVGKPYKGENNGAVEFIDPRPFNYAVTGMPLAHKHVIQSKEGMGLLFRSDNVHIVHPFYGKGTRIAIAYNIGMTEKKK